MTLTEILGQSVNVNVKLEDESVTKVNGIVYKVFGLLAAVVVVACVGAFLVRKFS